MGLLDLAFPGNQFSAWLDPNRNKVTGFFGGMVGGGNDPRGTLQGAINGLQGGVAPDNAFVQQQQLQAEKTAAVKAEQDKQNATIEWLKQRAPKYAEAVAMGAMSPADAWKTFLADQQGGTAADPTATVEGRTQLASQYGLNPDETKLFVLTGKLPGGNDTPRYGNAPIYARGPNGDYIAIQPGSDGSLNNLSSQLPPGYKIDPGALNSDKAAGTAWGTAQGGAQFNLPAAKQNIDLEIANIDAILSDDAGLSQTFGNAVQAGPIGIPNQWLPTFPNTPKANLQERVKQVVGQNFLQAFASLKGAGAITETEGSKAQEAMARLGSAQDRASFEQALKDLKDVLKIGYDRMSSQAASGPYQSGGFVPPALGGSNMTSSGIQWSVTP